MTRKTSKSQRFAFGDVGSDADFQMWWLEVKRNARMYIRPV